MRWSPSGVRGPVLSPPCILHLPFGIASPLQLSRSWCTRRSGQRHAPWASLCASPARYTRGSALDSLSLPLPPDQFRLFADEFVQGDVSWPIAKDWRPITSQMCARRAAVQGGGR
jgi:hypothetical protein